jgi:hypothetical protein
MKRYVTPVCPLFGLYFFLIVAICFDRSINIFGDNLAMKLFITPFCVLLGLSCCLIPTIASAQSTDTFGNGGDNRDPFSRASTGDTSGLLNLINQAQLNGKNNPNYSNEQREQMNSATEDFRARQLQLLRDRNNKTNSAIMLPPR